MQSCRPQIPLFNVLAKDNFTSSQVLNAIENQPPLNKQYPLIEVKSISKSIKQRSLSVLQTILREISYKSKFPCFTYSLRQLVLVHHLCILNNSNFCTHTLQFISHLIKKIHLYSSIGILGQKKTQVYDAAIYIDNILQDLISLLLQKGQFQQLFQSVSSTADTIVNSMSLSLFWMLIQAIKVRIDPQSHQYLKQILQKTIGNKQCSNFILKAASSNKQICLDYLLILRQQQQKLDKFNLLIQNSKLVKQSDTSYNWPSIIKQAYISSPKFNPFNISSNQFKQVYDNILLLQVFCSSPHISQISDYVTGSSYDVFVQLIHGQRFSSSDYVTKLDRWISVMKNIQKNNSDKLKMKQVKQDILTLTN